MLQHGDRRAEIGEHRSELKSDESAPMITSRCGSSSTSIRPVLVYTPGVVRMPGMSGMCGVAPVLMNIMSAATATGPSAVVISALWAPVKRARPVITVMLSWSASLW